MYAKIADALRAIPGLKVLVREDTEDFLLAWEDPEDPDTTCTARLDYWAVLDDDDVEELGEYLDDLDEVPAPAPKPPAKKPRARARRKA